MYELLDGVARAAAHPKTFRLPSAELVNALRPGDYAKLGFISSGMAERMWVEIKSVKTLESTVEFTGNLDNDPAYLPLECGVEVVFTSCNVIALITQDGDVAPSPVRTLEEVEALGNVAHVHENCN